VIVLGLDTATDICGVAVVESASGGERVLCDFRLQAGSSHAEHLLVLINRALGDLKLTMADLDGVALTIGPGSFTGLRVAVSTIKGFLAGFKKPVAPISTLEALAGTVSFTRDLICPMLDAKKLEVYAALFVFSESGELKRLMEDQTIAPATWLKQLSASGEGPILFMGDGAIKYRELIVEELGRRARFATPVQQASTAMVVARLGLDRIRKGRGVEAGELVPTYLRRSDAEVNLEKKRSVERIRGHAS
jgi:tRNA threonylcarbamoyladenosine biosynthesis protein TsaB